MIALEQDQKANISGVMIMLRYPAHVAYLKDMKFKIEAELNLRENCGELRKHYME